MSNGKEGRSGIRLSRRDLFTLGRNTAVGVVISELGVNPIEVSDQLAKPPTNLTAEVTGDCSLSMGGFLAKPSPQLEKVGENPIPAVYGLNLMDSGRVWLSMNGEPAKIVISSPDRFIQKVMAVPLEDSYLFATQGFKPRVNGVSLQVLIRDNKGNPISGLRDGTNISKPENVVIDKINDILPLGNDEFILITTSVKESESGPSQIFGVPIKVTGGSVEVEGERINFTGEFSELVSHSDGSIKDLGGGAYLFLYKEKDSQGERILAETLVKKVDKSGKIYFVHTSKDPLNVSGNRFQARAFCASVSPDKMIAVTYEASDYEDSDPISMLMVFRPGSMQEVWRTPVDGKFPSVLWVGSHDIRLATFKGVGNNREVSIEGYSLGGAKKSPIFVPVPISRKMKIGEGTANKLNKVTVPVTTESTMPLLFGDSNPKDKNSGVYYGICSDAHFEGGDGYLLTVQRR